ncbi:MAG: hypothetical protein BWY72_00906 [Bacteroidetes bacterium ADurb.Bin416]|nr:MAG: hypothetical protein BWY72_00906 [Bacteroidetes bacterium ADurb.Bin416]
MTSALSGARSNTFMRPSTDICRNFVCNNCKLRNVNALSLVVLISRAILLMLPPVPMRATGAWLALMRLR